MQKGGGLIALGVAAIALLGSSRGYPQAVGDAQGGRPGGAERPPAPRPELPPEAAERVKDLEKRIEELRQRGLEGEDRTAQDEALAEAIRLAEEVVAIREKHQGPGDGTKPEKPRAEWFELADARWKVLTLRTIKSMSWADRALLAKAGRQAGEGWSFFQKAQYEEAEPLLRQSLDILRRLLANHPDVALALNNLAGLLKLRGDLQGAEPLFRQSLDLLRQFFPGDHPSVANLLKNLAILLHEQGDLLGAEPLLRESIDMSRRIFPGGHESLAKALNSMASVLEARGDLQGAESLFREALDMKRRLISGDHPNMAKALSNLASVLEARGDLQGAESLLREALDMKRRLISGDHPNLAVGLNDLGNLLHVRGDLRRAELLLREALDMRRRLFPGDHPHVAHSLSNLALLLLDRGDLQDAEPLCREAVDMRRRLFVGDHRDVPQGLNNLARLLQDRGDLQGAERLYREALEMQRRLFPRKNPDVAVVLNNLASVLQRRGDLGGAEQLIREALDIRRRVFEKDHPRVALSLVSLAALLQVQGDLQGTEPLYREALDMRRRLFPGDHPHVAVSLDYLARLLQVRGDLRSAEPILREALDMRRRLFPGDHPHVVMGLDHLARLLQDRGDLQAAEALSFEALKMAEGLRPQIVGDEYARGLFAAELRVQTLATQTAEILIRLGRAGEALAVAERGRGREFLDLLTRRPLDLVALARERAAGDSRTIERLEKALLREEGALIEVTTSEARAGALQRERTDWEIRKALDEVKGARQKLSEAGAAVLVELRGLYPDARPLSGDEVVAALPEGDLVLSYLGSEKTLVLATAFEERTSGLVVSPDADGIRQIQAVASRVRVWIATRLQSNDDYGGEAAARELLRILLPDEALALARKARRLVVLPDGPLNDIPFDLLLALSGDAELEGKAVVHAASATVYLNRLRAPERPGPQTLSALVVADPLYEREPRPGAKYPEAGALIAQVLPGTSAAEAQLARGDIIIEYDGRKLGPDLALPDAIRATEEAPAKGERPEQGVLLRYWRSGEMRETMVAPGRLGVQVVPGDPRPHLIAMARAARGEESQKAEVSATDQVRLFGGSLASLPGTRREAVAIAEAFGKAKGEAKLLLGEEATVRELSAAVEGKRFLHLATHGLMGSSERPYDASLALTRPKEPTPDDIGFLRLDDIIREWQGKLEGCDLVVLSACNSQRGVKAGESMLALPWGFFYAGARTVIASLWEVDDEATALLMGRLYENLLGAFGEPRKLGGREYAPGTGLPPEPALREARSWLRGLTLEEAERARKRLEGLAEVRGGLPRGPGKAVRAPKAKPEASARPYAHPYYWAAFICVGKGE